MTGREGADRLWTRNEVAAYLGKTVDQVIKMEKRGTLSSTRDPNRIARGGRPFALFDPDEVRALRAHEYRAVKPDWKAGELSAEVFRAFDRNLSLPEIVDAFEVDPDRVAELYKMWRARDLDKVEAEKESGAREVKLGPVTVEPLAVNAGQGAEPRPGPIPDLERRWPSYYRPGPSPILEALRAAVSELDPDAVAGALVQLCDSPKVRGFMANLAGLLAQVTGGGKSGDGSDGAEGDAAGAPAGAEPAPPGGQGLGGQAISDPDGDGRVVGPERATPPGEDPDLGREVPRS